MMTAYRSQTDEMLAAKYDPKPWRFENGERYATSSPAVPFYKPPTFDPRPEFIPHRFYDFPYQSTVAPNPVLVDLRNRTGAVIGDAEDWLLYLAIDSPSVFEDDGYAPAHIEHARKVLARLAHMRSAV